MSAMSNFAEDELVKHFFRTGTFGKVSALWVALWVGDPGEAGLTGTEVPTTPTLTNYARQNLPPLDANWSASADGETHNLITINYGTPTPAGSSGVPWGTITHFTIWSLVTAGNMYFHGSLAAPKPVGPGDPAPSFQPGSISIVFQ